MNLIEFNDHRYLVKRVIHKHYVQSDDISGLKELFNCDTVIEHKNNQQYFFMTQVQDAKYTDYELEPILQTNSTHS